MDNDPYEALGVPRNADAGTIKRAHRERAQRAHPDKPGGDAETFKLIQGAYELLSDPERRRRFDESGDRAPAQDPMQAARMVVAKMVVETVGRVPDVEHLDLVAIMSTSVRGEISTIRSRIRTVEEAIAKHERARARFTKKGEGENIIAQVIDATIAQARASLERGAADIAAYERVLVILDDYAYTMDSPQWPGGVQLGQGGIFEALQRATGAQTG